MKKGKGVKKMKLATTILIYCCPQCDNEMEYIAGDAGGRGYYCENCDIGETIGKLVEKTKTIYKEVDIEKWWECDCGYKTDAPDSHYCQYNQSQNINNWTYHCPQFSKRAI